MTRAYHTHRARPKQSTGPGLRFWLIIGGGLLAVVVAAVGLLSSERAAAREGVQYDLADVATAEPFVAMHEMGDGAPIPFLPKDGPQPKAVVPSTFYNFGKVGAIDIVERTFVIRNEGEAPLTISRAYTTCGCTTAEISSLTIPPGKLATVNVVFDAGFHADAVGQTVRRGVILENNDPQHSQTEIWIEAAITE